GNPASVHLVSKFELSGLVVHLDDDVFAEVLEGDLRAKSCAIIPNLVGPLFKFDIVGDAAFQGHGFIFGATGGLAAGTGVAAVAVLHHLSGALQRGNLTDSGDVFSVPFHPEFEVLIWVKT